MLGTAEEGIRRERELLAPIRALATTILDTSQLSLSELRLRIAALVPRGAYSWHRGAPFVRARAVSAGRVWLACIEVEIVVGHDAEQVEHLVGQLAVLGGQNHHHPRPRLLAQRQDHRGHLDGFGAGADDAGDGGGHGKRSRSKAGETRGHPEWAPGPGGKVYGVGPGS